MLKKQFLSKVLSSTLNTKRDHISQKKGRLTSRYAIGYLVFEGENMHR